MRIILRHLKEGETDWEKLVGLYFLPLFALALLIVQALPPNIAPFCLFRETTGIPCFTCGATRCLRTLVHGDVVGAFLIQPLISILLLLGLLYFMYSAATVLFRLPRVRWDAMSSCFKWIFAGLLVLAVLANWLYLIRMGR